MDLALRLLFVLGAIGHCHAAADLPNVVYYPSAGFNETSLRHVVNGSGPPGVYTGSSTPQGQYGTYNWCNMPHVRPAEYVRPPSNYTLRYVEVIQRHHKRTPYASNIFHREDVSWDCIGEGPYVGGKSRVSDGTAGVYLQGARGTGNPFEAIAGHGFEGSTCQFPAITSQGLHDAKQHGADFRAVYGDMLGFLPQAEERSRYQWRVTNNPVTSQTLSGFIKGIFPGTDVNYAIVQPDRWDSLEPAFSCPLYNSISNQIRGTNANWTAHLTSTRALRTRFNAVSGIEENDTAGWAASWDHPYDNLSAKQCHGLPLPCSINDTATCVSQADADAIYRLGNWEYAYTWRGHRNSTLASVLRMGPWMQELQRHLGKAADGQSAITYLHKRALILFPPTRYRFAHDGSLAALLGLLQIDQPVWPGMGSEIVFELYSARVKSQAEDVGRTAMNALAVGSTSGFGGFIGLNQIVSSFSDLDHLSDSKDETEPNKVKHYIRVLWGGQPIVTSTPLGRLDLIPLGDFNAYLDGIWPQSFVDVCGL